MGAARFQRRCYSSNELVLWNGISRPVTMTVVRPYLPLTAGLGIADETQCGVFHLTFPVSVFHKRQHTGLAVPVKHDQQVAVNRDTA